MKTTIGMRRQVAIGLTLAALAAGTGRAATYYWDANGTTAGFGTAGGTWGTSQYWSTDNTGLNSPGVN